MQDPAVKRAISFFDGQNLFHHARAAFGHNHPNYDPVKLHRAVCEMQGWEPVAVRFYTGVHTQERNAFWHSYWVRRKLAMERQGITVITRPLHYREIRVFNQYGQQETRIIPQEKGIDVRLALDVIRLARENAFDVGIIFSQDQDLAEVAHEVRAIAREQQRWIKLACAFPHGANATASRGIDRTDWIRIDEATYNACLDPRDYRPRQA